MNCLLIQVLSRGSLVDSGTKNGQGKVSFIFNLLATTDFAPNCHLLVYYTKNTDEIVADSLAINVAGIFKNDVSHVTVFNNEVHSHEVKFCIFVCFSILYVYGF